MNLNKPREFIYQEFRGFLHIQCKECGKIRTFCPQGPETHYVCECGHVMELGKENITKAIVRCECGKRTAYRTNISAKLIEIDCIVCGYPNTLEWSDKRKRYIPIREKVPK